MGGFPDSGSAVRVEIERKRGGELREGGRRQTERDRERQRECIRILTEIRDR